MLFDWKSILIFIGAAQGLTFGLLLLFSKSKDNYKSIFGWLMVLFALQLTEYGIFRSEKSFHYAVHLFGYRYPLRFCIGPLFFIYTLGLTQKTKLKFWQKIIHFIPAFISFLLLVPLLIKSSTEKQAIFNHFTLIEAPHFYKLISALAITSVLSIVVYVVISLKRLFIYKQISQEYHSNEGKIWIASFYRFAIIYLIILIGYLVAIILRVFQLEFFNLSILFLIMSFLLIINLIILAATVFKQNRIIPLELILIKEENDKSIKNKIEIKQEDLEAIDNIMISKKLFLDYNFTINDLAAELNMPAYLLSKTINNGFNKTFFKYVNEFRIKHAKHLLVTTNIKILAVALDSGFSNKASFHRTFKRMEGTTPYEYRLKN